MKPPASMAWENGPTGGVSAGEVIAVLLMENSCGQSVHFLCAPERSPDRSSILGRCVPRCLEHGPCLRHCNRARLELRRTDGLRVRGLSHLPSPMTPTG